MTKEEIIKFFADHDITIAKHHHDKLTRWLTHTIVDEWTVYDKDKHIYTGNFDDALKALVLDYMPMLEG